MHVATRSRLAVTLGDPRGIGPEIVLKALADDRVRAAADWVLIGPSGGSCPVDIAVGTWTPGNAIADAGRIAGRAIEQATAMAMARTVAGIVTAPIDKSALGAAGYLEAGHTELLGRLTGARTVMMLASDRLRVVLVTTHLALSDVVRAVTRERIVHAARVARQGLADWFGMRAPRLALCALNPHAGDHGRFGDEDDRVLTPAAREAKIAGPFPADTVFVRALRGEFDAVLAPYHDVGMTAIKVASFGEGVNVTLGLPFPRTSPDHGTALDIAGRGVADASSMIRAMIVAAEMAATGSPATSRDVR
jgi:4-hydroxythreonine-4-phosphate dehydrogenase